MIAIKYSLFAVIATGVNLLFQFFSLQIYTEDNVGKILDIQIDAIYVAMFIGTIAGLVAKYILDKKYIFYHKPETKSKDLEKFIAYAFTGVFTTIIFWGTELAFNATFEHPSAKYIGAVIGLSIGYVMKYLLDKRFVFTESSA